MSTKTEATLEDLYKVDGKAELVNGEIVLMSPTGRRPSLCARISGAAPSAALRRDASIAARSAPA